MESIPLKHGLSLRSNIFAQDSEEDIQAHVMLAGVGDIYNNGIVNDNRSNNTPLHQKENKTKHKRK